MQTLQSKISKAFQNQKTTSELMTWNGQSLLWQYFYDHAILPTQGFKLHISAHMGNKEQVFDAVFPILKKYQTPFKIISRNEDIIKLNTGLFGNAQVGKFITVYPKQNELKKTVYLLHEKTKDLNGPIITSDKRFLDGIIYYRYGAIQKQDAAHIKSHDGALIKETRLYQDAIPSWIKDPFQGSSSQEEQVNIFGNIIIKKVLRQRGRGGVFSAIEFMDLKSTNIIIKESRPYGEYFSKTDNGLLRLQNESNCLQILQGQNIAPDYIDFVAVAKDHYFLKMEKLSGISLKDLLLNYNFNEKTILKNMLKVGLKKLQTMHNKGIYHLDITPDNMIIGDDIYFIDFESSFYKNSVSQGFQAGTKNFSLPQMFNQQSSASSKKIEMIRQDYFSFITCLLSVVEVDWYKKQLSSTLEIDRISPKTELGQALIENRSKLMYAKINKNFFNNISESLNEIIFN